MKGHAATSSLLLFPPSYALPKPQSYIYNAASNATTTPTIPPTPASIVGAAPADFAVAAALLDFVGVPDSPVESSFVVVITGLPEGLAVVERVMLPVSMVVLFVVGMMKMLVVPLLVYTENLLAISAGEGSIVVSAAAVVDAGVFAGVEAAGERNVSQF